MHYFLLSKLSIEKDYVYGLCYGEVDVGDTRIQLASPWNNRMKNMGLIRTLKETQASEHVIHEKDTG